MNSNRPRLIVFLSHPIQHYVPWFAELHRRLEGRFRVVFASRHGLDAARDPEFGQVFSWDMDLLEGYSHEFYPGAETCSPSGGFLTIRFASVEDYLRRVRPDAVMIFGWLFRGYWEVALASRRLGIPFFLRTESNLLNHSRPLKWWIKNRTVGTLCRAAFRCLAIGLRNAALYRAYGVPDDRILVAPYFVDNAHFAAESVRLALAKDALRDRFGLPFGAYVFLFMGKLIPKKHPDHLLAAWRAMRPDLRDRSALLIAGSGEMFDALRASAVSESRVVFSGFLNRQGLPEAYAASDALVLPSDEGETWGLVVNEAMASGLPVVVSDRVGSGPDLVIPGETGSVYPFGNVDALRQCLERIIENPAGTRAMGDKARRHVETASVERSVDAVVDALAATSNRNSTR